MKTGDNNWYVLRILYLNSMAGALYFLLKLIPTTTIIVNVRDEEKERFSHMPMTYIGKWYYKEPVVFKMIFDEISWLRKTPSFN